MGILIGGIKYGISTDKVSVDVLYFEFGKFFSDEDGTTLYRIVGKFPKKDMVALGKEFYFNRGN